MSLAVLAPNAVLLAFRPVGGFPAIRDAGLVFTLLERAGQAGCLALLTMSGVSGLDGWAIAALGAIAVYWGLWLRYLARGRHFADLYAPLGVVPVPMAVFPVAAFALSAAWALSPWLSIAVFALAVGHLANSWAIRQSIRRG